MTTVAKRCNKAEGTIVPAALENRYATRVIFAVLRLRNTACCYAQDDIDASREFLIARCVRPLLVVRSSRRER